MKLDVLTIGAAVRDLYVRSQHFERVKDAHAPDGWDSCFPMGAKIDVDEFTTETGGGATNAATTFANWGFQTACVSRVGTDEAGGEILRDLHYRGIHTEFVQQDAKHPTAHSMILVAGTGSRSILVYRGASEHLNVTSIPWKRIQASWLYVTSIGGDLKALKKIFAEAHRMHARIAWNPGSRELHHGMKALAPFLAQTDILFLNREEGALLSDCSPHHLEKILDAIGDFPRLALVLTDGAYGAYAYARGGLWHVAPKRGKIINTTGAGDAFGSGFVASCMTNDDLLRALRFGTLNAHGVVTHMGAKKGILSQPPGKLALAGVPIRTITNIPV